MQSGLRLLLDESRPDCRGAPPIAARGTNYASGFAYNPAFQVTGFNYGNGVAASLTYTPERLLLQSQFTSYERDGGTNESDNDYAMARYHVNRLGRFSSPDLIGSSVADPQTLNRYAYVRNDPGNLVDPLGLMPQRIIYSECEFVDTFARTPRKHTKSAHNRRLGNKW